MKYTHLSLVALLLACLGVGPFTIRADVPRPRQDGTGPIAGKPPTRAELVVYQSLLDLESPFTLLSVGVHPGDEDADALAYHRMMSGVRTAILTANFGERGDNAVTDDFDEALGVLRSRELRRSAEVLDAEVFSLGTRDAGPARTAEEVLSRWGREETLKTLVLTLRRVRPDVVILPGGRRDGQDRALRLLVLEARGLAADPNRYPDQLATGLTPWSIRSILEKVPPGDARGDVRFDSNESHPFRRRRYSAIALDALKFEASQGPWPERDAANPVPNGYRYLFPAAAPETPLPDLFADIVSADPIRAAHAALTADLFKGGKPAERWIAARAAATPAEAANRRLVDDLLQTLRQTRLQALNNRERAWFFKWFETKLERAVGLLAGIEVKVTATPFVVVPGEECSLRVTVTNSGEWPLILRRVGMTLPPAWEYSGDFSGGVENDIPFDPGQNNFFTFRVRQPDWTPRTRPAAAHLADPDLLTPQIATAATVVLGNTRFQVGAQTRIELSDPLSIEGLPDKIPVRTGAGPVTVDFSVQRWTGTVSKGKLLARGLGGIAVRPAEIPITFVGEKATVAAETVAVLPRVRAKDPGLELLWVPDGAPKTAKPLVVRRLAFVPVTVATQPRLRVGIVRGFDPILPRTLDVLGVKHRSLTQADWESGALRKNFDTVVLDRRAYRADPELSTHRVELMEFVEQGGRLVVLGQRPDEFKPEWAAFPVELGVARVARPDAPVRFLTPAHPLMTVPNRLTPEDFSGWTVERGAFFPVKWDDRYEAVLETGDPGEKPEAGGILVAQRGKGRYVYVALDLSRQLRAAHPGCFKLVANLLGGAPGS